MGVDRTRKLVVASVGVAALIGSQIAGVEFGDGFTEAAVTVVIGLLTAFGVYRVPNAP